MKFEKKNKIKIDETEVNFTKGMIEDADKWIKLVSRSLFRDFYVREEIRGAFEKARKKGVEIEIAYDKNAYTEENDFINFGERIRIKFYPLKSVSSKDHFWITDKNCIKEEIYHGIFSKKRCSVITFDNPLINAYKYIEDFNTLRFVDN